MAIITKWHVVILVFCCVSAAILCGCDLVETPLIDGE